MVVAGLQTFLDNRESTFKVLHGLAKGGQLVCRRYFPVGGDEDAPALLRIHEALVPQ
jgi:hypothetical protein